MLRMEQLGDWLAVEKLFRQVTDSTHAFLLSVGRLSITFTSNNLLPFQYDLDVKKYFMRPFMEDVDKLRLKHIHCISFDAIKNPNSF